MSGMEGFVSYYVILVDSVETEPCGDSSMIVYN
jgi:hypothetical protein